jgi:putative flippase GtrA
VGGITFLADAGTLEATWRLGAALPVATTIGYLLGLACHFMLNRRFTFGAHQGQVVIQLPYYLLNVLFSFLVTQAIVNGGYALWPVFPSLWKACAVAVTMTTTFVALRSLVFRSRASDA